MKLKLATVTLGVIGFGALVGAALDVVRLAWEPEKGTSARYAVRKTYETEFSKIIYEFDSVVRVEAIEDGKVVASLHNS